MDALKSRLTMAACIVLIACLPSLGQKWAIPKAQNGRYSIALDGQVMHINPAKGGRITSLIMDGEDFLTDSTVNDFNWGSTFWFSPQKDWKWPPSAEIDNQPYEAKVQGSALVLTSRQDRKTGLVVIKEISGNISKQSFIIKYTIRNASDAEQRVAPWEVTRVHTGGTAFFPVGLDKARGGLLHSTEVQQGVFWYVYQKEKLPAKGDRQIYADGSEGWLAQLNGDRLLVKQFPDITLEQTAPEEGEVELFASELSVNGSGYVEIEHQGAYLPIKPGSSVSWTTTWLLRKVPAVVDRSAGSRSLADYVRGIVK
ncbi:DUF4380 domain-containing protein [Dyadobacter sp. CY261]|uniref:DUF4380 domain-containing protein n=1 Tax=Dyadobacter sp. CY261 TaxID=2907203 RepID=UPI001F441BEE|nr:DUF4380 domain-containing protein [Dyadobacter sp. CY261]MCF0072958.1 DUF4380 domain-containing protein [Dyadobacter sp. CY261]